MPAHPAYASSLLALARRAIAADLAGEPAPRADADGARAPGGVFVTLWGAGRMLRGCIGRIGTARDVAAEVASCAVAAATRDPRFEPLSPGELAGLSIEVSLLGAPEPAAREALDPARYGVVVTQGRRRGVLLPEVDGIETVADQIETACRKGGIDPAGTIEILRFTVEKLRDG